LALPQFGQVTIDSPIASGLGREPSLSTQAGG
jgi:hypothetical protein